LKTHTADASNGVMGDHGDGLVVGDNSCSVSVCDDDDDDIGEHDDDDDHDMDDVDHNLSNVITVITTDE
jgi:hypothetical protein